MIFFCGVLSGSFWGARPSLKAASTSCEQDCANNDITIHQVDLGSAQVVVFFFCVLCCLLDGNSWELDSFRFFLGYTL